MSKIGWIKLHRKLMDNDMWLEERFTKGQAWVDLLMMANHEDKEIIFDSHWETVRAGSFITSVRKLSARWQWDKTTTLKYLRLLEEGEMITRKSDNRRTLINIVNYCVYQENPSAVVDTKSYTESDTQSDSNSDTLQTLRGHSIATNKNDKNDKNDKKTEEKNYIAPKRRFVRPTLEEVQAYCQQRGNNVDAERFCDFYEMKGWKVGREIMKDWKAAVRTWEKNDNDRRGSSGGSRGNGGSRGPGGYDWDNL